MMRLHTSLFGLLAASSTAAAHGYVDVPPARQAGKATASACGLSIQREIRRDNASHIEGLPELADKDKAYNKERCNLWLCRGIQYDDNAQHVQTFSPGQVVNMKVKIIIPHRGSANVSVVNTATNTVLGGVLVAWPSGYADVAEFYSKTLPTNNTDFNITIPDMASACHIPGQCVSYRLPSIYSPLQH